MSGKVKESERIFLHCTECNVNVLRWRTKHGWCWGEVFILKLEVCSFSQLTRSHCGPDWW